MIQTTTVGNYPKLSSTKGDVNIRKMLHRFDKGEIAAAELTAAYDQVTARVLREQREAGIDLPTDGQIRWDDLVTPLAARLDGFHSGGLLRWFDNNVYYRRPRVTGTVRWREAIMAADHAKAAREFGGPVKAVLPAPFSFAQLCEDQHYRSMETLMADLVSVLRSETEALIRAGARHIQFDEPCLPKLPEYGAAAIAALNQVIAGQSAEFWLCFYFGDISGLVPALREFRGQVIAVDCVSQPRNLDITLNLDSAHNRCFGIIEARNIKLERPEQVRAQLERISGRHPDAYVSPSCGLEFLPHRDALAKLSLLGSAVRAFRGGQ